MTVSSVRIISRWLVAIILGSVSLQGIAQLSPGDLAQVHAHLEGISNCTQCHTLGQKISNDKCLDCHDEIAGLIDDSRGFHADQSVRGQDCFACHSDHHGRKFDMVRFDTETFDHNLTGYSLTGQHATVDCRACHTSDNIADAELRKRDDTFLGLSNACIGCHDDYHQNTLGNECASCHTTQGFRPADNFDHDETSFALTGEHINVECAQCHTVTTRNGSEFQEFAGTDFTTCASCHEDAHDGRFGAKCADCHNTTSFHTIAGRTSFDHDATGFPLRGSHAPLNCASCHDADAGVQAAFSDFAHLDVINCTNCHDDVHEGRFGLDCASCHNVTSFRQVSGIDAFDHSLTDFPLEGMHTSVDCKECHTESMTAALAHNACVDCHDDHHEGQFSPPECARCHTVQGFEGSTFGIGQHAETDFPLEGAHLATPCFACHLQDEEWHFTDMGMRCADCHDNIHEGKLDERFYPGEACTSCHLPDNWVTISFDHSATDFDLEGRHLEARCGACHRSSSGVDDQVVFTGLATECQQCHEDPHGGQFADIQGAIRCAECHQPVGWAELRFEHDSTSFSLTGAHTDVACIDCHQPDVTLGEEVLMYRGTPVECAACHN